MIACWTGFLLQAKLHKQRSDTNCAESPWVSQRSQLPAQQFVWPAPPAGADPGTPAQGKFRKVRVVLGLQTAPSMLFALPLKADVLLGQHQALAAKTEPVYTDCDELLPHELS
jgi:hypothetical protein